RAARRGVDQAPVRRPGRPRRRAGAARSAARSPGRVATGARGRRPGRRARPPRHRDRPRRARSRPFLRPGLRGHVHRLVRPRPGSPRSQGREMTFTDYIIDILLIAVVFRQMRARELTPGSVVLPVILVGVACANYLKAFTPRGNDVLLIT